MVYAPGAAVAWLNPEQPFSSIAADESSRTSTAVQADGFSLQNRQNIQPKQRLKGRNRPAREAPRFAACAFIAVVPPLRGLLVSMVNWTVCAPFAARPALMLEKWQLTAAGSDAQPIPMLASANPPTELSVTATVAFCPVVMDTLDGLTVRLKPVGVPEIAAGCDVEELCSASPL